ncbi:MAG: hypothetical protein U9R08_03695 [Nanoarchaeota archaeon]|nr:hypothetical protein [Nanoarchaeota archaeon]
MKKIARYLLTGIKALVGQLLAWVLMAIFIGLGYLATSSYPASRILIGPILFIMGLIAVGFVYNWLWKWK